MHEIISEAQYRAGIGKAAGGAFFFFGEEDYLKAVAVRQTREAISPDPAFAFFNDVTIDGIDYTPDLLLDAISPPPMGADARLVVLRGLDFGAMRAGEQQALLDVLAELPQYDYTTLILHFAAGKLEEGKIPAAPSAAVKRLAEVAVPVYFDVQTDARLAAWVGKHFAHLGVEIGRDDALFLMEYVGKSMYTLAGEIEKLAAYVKSQGGSRVDAAMIRLVASPTLSMATFAFSNAILGGKQGEALHALEVMRFERVDPIFILGELTSILALMKQSRLLLDEGKSLPEITKALFRSDYQAKLYCRAAAKVDAGRLSRTIEAACEADRELKRGSGSYAALEKLICSI